MLGGVLDIAADRTYEMALWIALADLGLVPAAIPLIVVARTSLTDGLRAVGVGRAWRPLPSSELRWVGSWWHHRGCGPAIRSRR